MSTLKDKWMLVTGGAGFIGSNFVHRALAQGYRIVVLDALTYAGDRANLEGAEKLGPLEFVEGKIQNRTLLSELFSQFRFGSVVHFAAESHVDNSINGPLVFVETNVLGTASLLEAARTSLKDAPTRERTGFRFLHVSTDEVFGSLSDTGYFTEATPYSPRSPYSSSKAGSDHLVRAWNHTYGLPTLVTNCSNNYGARQHPEKLIPHMIQQALTEKPLPVYGQGQNTRDWIYVNDHCDGLLLALERGQPGATYCFGGRAERKNLDVVHQICALLDAKRPRASGQPYAELIRFVTDRPGHDWRYAIDDSLAEKELGFKRSVRFEEGLSRTVDWYLQNPTRLGRKPSGKERAEGSPP